MTGLLTARQVADRFDHSPETILRWYRRGDLDGIAFKTPGGRLRFREDRLDAWIAEKATTPPRGVVTQPARGRRPGRNLAGVTQPDHHEEV